MQKEKFIKQHSAAWEKLESLSTAINQQGIKKLSSTEVKDFLQLFRQCSHHLAYARTHYPQSNIVDYLNTLIGECHSQVYTVKKVSPSKFSDYIFYRLPELLKQYKWYLTASFGFFSLGIIVGLCIVLYNPEQAQLFLPAQYIESIKGGNSGASEWNYALMSSQIMVNNITVALKALIFGITLGLGTSYILFYNGTLLGALTAIVYLYGTPLNYWSLILPHGIIELPAIWISGAAGLIIAKHLLLPGDYTRKDSLISGTKKAVLLVPGIVMLLVIAGLIEGFFTPRNIGAEFKLIFAAIMGMFLVSYLLIPYFRKPKLTD